MARAVPEALGGEPRPARTPRGGRTGTVTNEATNHGEATVSTQGRRPVVRLERVLARAPEAVWLVLTDELDSPFAARNAAGWQVCLARLTGDTSAGDAWQQHFERYTAAFEPALGPQEGPPSGH